MKDLNTLLREGDPAAGDSGLSPESIAAMRRAVLTEAPRTEQARRPWHQSLALAAMVALTIAAAVVAGRRTSEPAPPVDLPAASGAAEGERRQIQFATPGGTRIIWVFDSEFQVKETVP